MGVGHFLKASAAALAATMVLSAQGAMADSIEVHNTMNPGGSEEAAMNKFKEIIEERLGDAFDVNIYMASQLGGENEVLELLNIGQTQMALTGGGFMGQYTPEYNAVSVPFVFPNWESVQYYIMETESGHKMRESVREQGNLVYLGPQMRGFRHMTSEDPIHSPEDLVGIPMRMPQIPVWIDIWEELGVQAVVIPAADIYLAMSTGQVKAHENSLASPYTRQMWEVQNYIVTTSHLSFPWHWVASASWWDGLTDEQRTIIGEAVEEARQYGTQVEAEKDEFYRGALIEKGMEFIDVDQGPFREKAMPAIDRALAEMAPTVVPDIESAIAAAAK